MQYTMLLLGKVQKVNKLIQSVLVVVSSCQVVLQRRQVDQVLPLQLLVPVFVCVCVCAFVACKVECTHTTETVPSVPNKINYYMDCLN